jgi:hypothetical protein
MSTKIDDIMDSLIRKQVLTTDMADLILERYNYEIEYNGGTKYFKVKTITLSEEALKTVNANYTYEVVEDFIPEVTEDLNSMPGVAGVASEVEGVENDYEISDDDIETALLRIERNELKTELIELEESTGVPEEESNNNQIEETNDGDGFEWF